MGAVASPKCNSTRRAPAREVRFGQQRGGGGAGEPWQGMRAPRLAQANAKRRALRGRSLLRGGLWPVAGSQRKGCAFVVRLRQQSHLQVLEEMALSAEDRAARVVRAARVLLGREQEVGPF